MSGFADTYPEARARFLEAVEAFEAATGRRCARASHAVVDGEDCTLDVAHFEPRDGRRLVLVTSGVHGVEGYAGNAIQRALLAGPLVRLATDWGAVLVHAVNPWGMANFRRVNAGNVDLNRNFGDAGDALYQMENPGYRLVADALTPRVPCDGVLVAHLRLIGGLVAALLDKGYAALRQALLAGQYAFPAGLFYGGRAPQREARLFAEVFEPLCRRYDEILLVDLHTGYGARGEAQLLWSVADSGELPGPQAGIARGASSPSQGYLVTGDLVAWCRRSATRINPAGRFDGIVLEVGTTGLSKWSQVRDLATVVRENQLHHYGARSPAVERAVKAAFREMFCPSDPSWRRGSLAAALGAIEELLARRGCLAP